MKDKEAIVKVLKKIPLKNVDIDNLIKGALILEGGAFRAVYQEGVLDCLLENGILFEATVGVSAGALNGVNYVTGQVGRSAHINIGFRHDGKYVGINAFIKSHRKGFVNLDYAFSKLPNIPDLRMDLLKDNKRKFVAVATSLETGKACYFDNSREDILDCVKASASLPYLSKPVIIDNKPYLDGGCDDRIPYRWALKNGYKKIVIIRTRDKRFRNKPNYDRRYGITKKWYSDYPNFAYNLARTDEDYNEVCNLLEEYEDDGDVFIIYPSRPIEIRMLEKNIDKLGETYFLGYNDCLNQLDKLKEYLNK